MAVKIVKKSISPDKTGGKQSKPKAKGKFSPGKSGNPKGRPPGARNKATVMAERLLDGETEAITNVCIKKAKDGDMVVIRLCMERLLPPRKGRPVCVKLPQLSGAMNIVEAHAAVISEVSKGTITLEEATLLSSLIDGYRKSVETEDLAKDVEVLKLAIKAA